jgi:hypothetical protein
MMNTREPCHDMGDFTSPHLCFGFGCCLFVGHWSFFYFLLEVRKVTLAGNENTYEAKFGCTPK